MDLTNKKAGKKCIKTGKIPFLEKKLKKFQKRG